MHSPSCLAVLTLATSLVFVVTVVVGGGGGGGCGGGAAAAGWLRVVSSQCMFLTVSFVCCFCCFLVHGT